MTDLNFSIIFKDIFKTVKFFPLFLFISNFIQTPIF
jgi:hypothetical protein